MAILSCPLGHSHRLLQWRSMEAAFATATRRAGGAAAATARHRSPRSERRHPRRTTAHAPMSGREQCGSQGHVRPARPRPGGAPAGPATTPFRPAADFDTMTVGDLDSYADSRPDWATDPALGARKDPLVKVLEFVRSGQPAPLGACEPMKVHDLESNGLASDDRESLRAYARGVQSTETAGFSSTPVLVDALTGWDRPPDPGGRVTAGHIAPRLGQRAGRQGPVQAADRQGPARGEQPGQLFLRVACLLGGR